MNNMIKKVAVKLHGIIDKKKRCRDTFHADYYLRLNQRRLEHLASLNLGLNSASVLEVGAGIGDHSSFFIDRNCRIVISEPRKENLEIIRSRYPDNRVMRLDLNNPPDKFSEIFDIVYCYGVLYHTDKPERAIKFMSDCCKDKLLLSTCVSFGDDEAVNLLPELKSSPSQSISGRGCRPTRIWIYKQLKKHFNHVYLPVTQPNNDDFPIDWSDPGKHKAGFKRAVFIASRNPIDNQLLTENIPMKQIRSS